MKENEYDVVVRSFALHYVASFGDICRKGAKTLRPGGHFVFSAEHPVFTAEGSPQLICDSGDGPLLWPVECYFDEGLRRSVFLGMEVAKYHRTLATYMSGLLDNGFRITAVDETHPRFSTSTDMWNPLLTMTRTAISGKSSSGRTIWINSKSDSRKTSSPANIMIGI